MHTLTAAICCLALAAAGAPAAAHAQDAPDYETKLSALTRGLPLSVATFIRRQAGCDHWAGEEPYDQARAIEIGRAEQELRCDKLDSDEKALRQRFSQNARVLDALDQAQQLEPNSLEPVTVPSGG